MNKPRYMTVAFEIRDNEKFEPVRKMLHDCFIVPEEMSDTFPPYRVVAMASGMEFDRLELIEQVILDEGRLIGDTEYQVRAIEEILALPHENTYELGLEVIRSWSDE